jgi:hypothetical protein
MRVLAVLSGIIALLCMAMGIVTLLGVLPPDMMILPDKLTWTFWFGISALLFLASIAANAGGRGGGDEY